MLLLKQSSLTLGKRDPHHIIVTSSYIPDNDNEANYGSVYFTYVLKDHRELAAEIKNIIVESFRQHFYQDLERNPEQSFEETLQAINDGASRIAQAENIIWDESLNITLGVFSKDDLHLSVGGLGCVYLGRGQHLTLISEGLLPDEGAVENKIFYSLASGNLINHDHVVLSTERLEDAVDMNALKNKLQNPGEDTGEEIPALKHAHLQIIDCEEATDEEPVLHQVQPEAPTHIHRPSIKEDEYKKAPSVLSSSNKLLNTVEILKENIQKSLERILNRSNRPLVRKSLPLNKIIAGALIGVVIISGLYWFSSVQQANTAKKNLQNLLTQVSNDKEQAKSRINIDRDSAKNLLLADQKDLTTALATTTDTILIAQIRGELGEIKQLIESADKVYRVDNPKVAYDLSQERSNFDGKGLVRLNNDLYAFDSDALYRLAMDKPTRRTVIVNGNTVNELELATSISKDGAIELYTKDHQLIEFKNDNFTALKGPSAEATWKNAVAIVEYIDRKFMYFLDPTGNTIWRYGTDTNGFTAPLSKNAAQLTLNQAVSLAVDGSVYVLSSDGQISKTYADEKKDFTIYGLTEPFNNPTKIVADKNQDTGSVYVLDAKNSRVVVLSKTGKYQAQYVFPGYTDLLDISLLPSLTKDQLMVLTKSGKVLQVELNAVS